MKVIFGHYVAQIICQSSVPCVKGSLVNGLSLNLGNLYSAVSESANPNCVTVMPISRNILYRNAFIPIASLKFVQLDQNCQVLVTFCLRKWVKVFLCAYVTLLLLIGVFLLFAWVNGDSAVFPPLGLVFLMLLFTIGLTEVSFLRSSKRMFNDIISTFPKTSILAKSTLMMQR